MRGRLGYYMYGTAVILK